MSRPPTLELGPAAKSSHETPGDVHVPVGAPSTPRARHLEMFQELNA